MYAIVDIETTGGHAAANGITEIAIHVHDGSRLLRHFKSLINPGKTIPSYITALTGISNEMVASAPFFEDVAEEIYGLLKDQVFVAHNVNFDFSFLKFYLAQSNFNLDVKRLCTVRLSRKVFPGYPSYSLGNICRNVGIEIDGRHRADGDARATVKLFEKILENGGHEHIDKMLKRNSAEHWLPTNLEKQQIDDLPAQPGVYYFHDEKGKVIYVGKAINIRKRVSSHFTHHDTEKKRQHFLRKVFSVSCTTCANELQALVLESTEIKRLWPKFNYSQKQPAQKYGLYSYEDNKGYMRLVIDRKKKNFPAHYLFNLLHEGLVMLKKMIDEFHLDHKLCYLDKTPLFEPADHEIDPPRIYNLRVNDALQAMEKRLPTFAIMDQGKTSEERLYLLVERGSFWGMGCLPAAQPVLTLADLKECLEPFADNDFIRNSLYAYADANPHKRINFNA